MIAALMIAAMTFDLIFSSMAPDSSIRTCVDTEAAVIEHERVFLCPASLVGTGQT